MAAVSRLNGTSGIRVAVQGKPPEAKDKSQVQTGWYLDYAQAKTLARQTGKPLFVVFRCEK